LRTLLRPGPVPLPGDSWDVVPSDAQPSPRPASNHRRRWSPRTIGILAVAIGVVVVAGIWLLPVAALPRSYGGPSGAGTDPDTVGATRAGPAPVASGVALVPGVGSAAGAPGTAGGPAGSPPGGGSGPRGDSGPGPGSGSTTSNGGGPPSGVGSPTETPDPTFAPFTELGYEAEAGLPAVKLLGAAEVVAFAGASGGQAVCYIGDWGDATPGSLQLRLNIPATGTYRVALSYVAEAVAGHATLVVTGSGPYPVTFPAGSNGIAVTTVDVQIVAGARNLTLSNSTGPVPLIDRLVITPI
jgi:hypothetical protein